MQDFDIAFNYFYEAINTVSEKHASYQENEKYTSKLKEKSLTSAGIPIPLKLKLNFSIIRSIRKIINEKWDISSVIGHKGKS